MQNALKIIIFIGLLTNAFPLVAATIRVPTDQPTIQAGIDAAQAGDTVLVAAGIYKGEGNKNLNFGGKPITLSSIRGAIRTTIDCENDGRGFIFNSFEQETSVLSGFTIKNGRVDGGGGAIYCTYASPTITNCIIIRNSATEWGGGIGLYYASPTIRNCVIARNTSILAGGGFWINGDSSIIIINSTITGNSTVRGGSIISGNAKIVNSIIWGNSPESLTPNHIIEYSDVQGGYPGEGNFHGDPLFIDPDNNNFHLLPSSPCIDAGTSEEAPNTDLDGNPRPQGQHPDIGSYELTGYDKLRPVIDFFTADIAEGFIPLHVVFTCSAHDVDGNIAGYRINYGDGSSLEANTSGLFAHTYETRGTNFATCTVTDDSGAETNSFSIIVKAHSKIRVPDNYSTIQAAIDAATPGDIVIVADGTYRGTGNKNLDFKGKAITVRSLNGPENCILDCENSGRGFWFHSGETGESILSGFTITRGEGRGGGILCSESSPTILSCIIKNNSSDYDYESGGGIYCNQCSATILNCLIFGNTAADRGGGIYCEMGSPKINNCTITANTCNSSYADQGGGGIFAENDCKPIITNCIISGNSPNELKAGGLSGFNVTYSNIKNGWIGKGNININPAFMDPKNNDYRLNDYSPCIGAGTTAGCPGKDIAGNTRPRPEGSSPDMGAYENSRGIRDTPPLDFFGMEVGNKKTLQVNSREGSYIAQTAVVGLDNTTFSASTYVFEVLEKGTLITREWYEKKAGQLRWWGTLDIRSGDFIKCTKSLLVAWNPMKVGESKYSSTTFTLWGIIFNMSAKADVLAKEWVSLNFGRFEAYKVKYEQRIWNEEHEYDENYSWFEWFVPYIGGIMDEDGDVVEKLTSFAIGAGTITQVTDADHDDLPDYKELLTYNTNWLDPDTDHDGMPDDWEIDNHLDPLQNDALADADGDGFSNLREYQFGTDPKDSDSHPPKAMPWIPLLLGD